MIQQWLDRIYQSRVIQWLLALAKRFKPWGFEGLSLYYVMIFFIEGLQKGGVATRAAAISFRLFIAIFPVIILLLSLIPYIPIENFQENLMSNIEAVFPGDTFSLVESTLNDLINHKYTSLVSIGFVLLLFYASNSVNAVLVGLNGSYHLKRKENFVITRIASILLLILLSVLLVAGVGLIIVSGVVFDWAINKEYLTSESVVGLLKVAKWLIAVSLIYFAISIIYNAGSFRRRKWKWFSAGSSFATLFFVVASILFAWFVNNLASYNKLYGSIGTLMVLLIWINFNSVILLLGFELNASIHRARRDAEKHNLVPTV